MLHSRKLRYIDEVARCGSIRKAAARLNVASSAINRQILELEEEFGAPLFKRLPRGLKLTAAGEICLDHIRDVLKGYGRFEDRLKALKMPHAGKISMVTTVGLAAGPLPELLGRFFRKHPRVRVKLLNDAGSITINSVLTGEADVGLGFNVPNSPQIRTLAVFDVPVGVVLPVGHALTAHERIDPLDMLREPLVICSPGNTLRDAIDLILAPIARPVQPILETNSVELMKQLVKQGNCLSMLNPLDVYAECRAGELEFRPFVPAYVRHQQLRIFVRSQTSADSTGNLFFEFLLREFSALVQNLQRSSAIPGPGTDRRSASSQPSS